MPFYMNEEEFRQAVSDQMAHIQSKYLEFYDFIERLSTDDMSTLAWILHRTEHDSTFAQHVIGVISGKSRWKDGVCGCGDDPHPVADHLDPEWVLGHQEPGFTEMLSLNDTEFAQSVHEFGHARFLDSATPEGISRYARLMSDYELTIENLPNNQDGSYLMWCHNCGKGYVSLADRMVKPRGVEGCEGCQQKAKWG